MAKPRQMKLKARVSAASPIKPRLTGAQLVYGALRHAIIALDIDPGAPLEEGQLCQQFKVSRTPVREALIRLASEGLVELEPNRSAKVASLQFVDVVDHYEAMDVFQPVTWHFAALRHNADDLQEIRSCLEKLRHAMADEDAEATIRSNYDIHRAIAGASHNRSIEKAYAQMLVDKLRVAQHAIRGTVQDRGHVLAKRFSRTFLILEELVNVLAARDGTGAERLARELNAHVREQIIELLSTSLAKEFTLPFPGVKERPTLTAGHVSGVSLLGSGRKQKK